MNKSIPTKLGAAIASALLLGGCATTSSYDEPKDPINRIASSVTEAGTRVWDGTRYLFKLKDNSGDTVASGDDEFLDEVDMALIDSEDFKLSNPDANAAQTEPLAEKDLIEPDTTRLLPPEDAQTLAADIEDEVTAPSNAENAEDLYHVVGENETLWVLAKMLTGNANNWRELAELNGLDENGSVYVGQKLRIPAALKRVPVDGEAPGLAVAANETETEQLQSDVTLENAPEPVAAKPEATEDQIHTVEAGESLWFLAERTTGDAKNWLAIAQYNGMDERAANEIRFGQKLKIPAELLIDGSTGTPVARADDELEPTREAADAVAKAILPSKGNDVPGIEAGKSDGSRELAVAAADESGADESKIVTVPASFESDPPADLPKEAKEAGDKHLLAEQPAAEGGMQDGEVMVSGTYYPKAIYNEANFSSSLLMRVSPGTRLKVAKTIGPWYEVVTDKGTGFVHSRDTN